MKITTKLASNRPVTFVIHKRFAVLFFVPSCCVNLLVALALDSKQFATGNWVELTSGTVNLDLKKKRKEKKRKKKEKTWPKADGRVPRNNPRNNCGTHLGPSPLLVSKAANSHANYKHLRRTIRVISPENLFVMLHSLNRGFAVRNPYVQNIP